MINAVPKPVNNVLSNSGIPGDITQQDYITTINGINYLKKLWTNPPKNDFAEQYNNKGGESVFIDENFEIEINDKILSKLNDVLYKSKKAPIFLSIGHRKHLVGLLITPGHIIITNSGEGLNYHNRYSDLAGQKIEGVPENYYQCILYFSRPSDNILIKILQEFYHVCTHYNTNIDSTYSIIFKLYYINIIKSLTEEKKLLFYSTMKTYINKLKEKEKIVDTPKISIIKKAAWINPDYHEQVIYNINTTNESNPINKFDYYKVGKEDGEDNMMIELFCDILLHDSSFKDNSILITKNNTKFKYKIDYNNRSHLNDDSPFDILINTLIENKLKENIPELYYLFINKKIKPKYPDKFFVREQFAGSCTYNGTLLAISLLGYDNIDIIGDDIGLKEYIDYNGKN